jgi:AcrR family transcriptional regulator
VGRKKQLSDADLLSFARAAFIREGLSAPTRAIAKAAGVSEAVLFQRYRTKAELFFAAMVPPPVELGHLLQESDAGFQAQLKGVFTALIGYFRAAHPILLQLSVHPDFRFDEFASKHPESSRIAMFQQLMGFLIDRLDPDRQPSGATLLLIAAAHSIASFEAMGAYGGRFEDGLVDNIFDCIWQGMKPKIDRTTAGPKQRAAIPPLPKTT